MKKVLYILGQLSDDDIEWMAQAGRCVVAQAGETIIKAGEAVGALFVILKGGAVVKLPNGVDVAKVGVGEILGEMSLVDRRPPSATVVAATATTLLAIDKGELTRKLDADHAFAARLYRAIATFLSDRMRSTNALLGFGGPRTTIDLNKEEELDESILNTVHLAGIRFEHILQKLSMSANERR